MGFVFYLLNSELAVYYKLVEAFPLVHTVFFVETLAFPLRKDRYGRAFRYDWLLLGRHAGRGVGIWTQSVLRLEILRTFSETT